MKRFTLLTIGILLLLVGQGWAADVNYYVDSNTGTSRDGTAATDDGLHGPWKLGTNINWTTIQNSVTAGADVYINLKRDSVWSAIWTVAANGTAAHHIKWQPYGTGAIPKFTNATRAILLSNYSYHDISGIQFTEISVWTGAHVTFNYCQSIESPVIAFDIAADDVHINNCGVYGCASRPLLQNAAASTVYVRNSVFIGCKNVLSCTSGVIDIDYSYIGGNLPGAETYTAGAKYVIGENNVLCGNTYGTYVDPKFTSWPYTQSVAMWFTDDTSNIAYVQSLAAAFNAGVSINFPVSSTQDGASHETDATDITNLTALQATGVHICNHNALHNSALLAAVFQVTSTNTTPTVNVDVAGGNIILTSVETSLTLPLAGNTIASLRAALPAGWTVVNTPLSTYCLNDTPLTVCASSGGAQACPYTTLPDKVTPTYGFYQTINTCKTWLNSTFGITSTTYSYPNGQNDATIQAWLKDPALGNYTGARSYTTSVDYLTSVPVYATKVITATLLDDYGTTQAAMEAMAWQLWLHQKMQPTCLSMMAHTAAELPVNSAAWLVNKLNALGVTWQSYDAYITAVRADHTPSGDGLTYTKSYTSIGDYSLKSNSPLKSTGDATVAVYNYDILGAAIGTTRDIGPYKGPESSGGGLTTGLGLGGGNFNPNWRLK